MTISINVQGLWDNWQRSQRDDNIRPTSVAHHRTLIQTGQALTPITFEKLVEESDGSVRIRTADGRHRITAAHELGVVTIQADDTPIAQSIKEIFGL